jgi:hypothetical protein
VGRPLYSRSVADRVTCPDRLGGSQIAVPLRRLEKRGSMHHRPLRGTHASLSLLSSEGGLILPSICVAKDVPFCWLASTLMRLVPSPAGPAAGKCRHDGALLHSRGCSTIIHPSTSCHTATTAALLHEQQFSLWQLVSICR